MQLARLRSGLGLPPDDAAARLDVHGIAYDSRQVRPGTLFVAVPGFHVDGHDYLDAAIAGGAVAVVVQAEHAAAVRALSVPVLAVPDTRWALSAAAAAFFGHPGRAMRVIGVTGTDGKTTTTYLISAVLEAAGYVTGLMGTVDFKVGPNWRHNDTRQTTPEALEVQELLAEMRDVGVTHAVVESSSHGLQLRKLEHCQYDAAVVTNVGADHLELHGTREAYLAAKGHLFELLNQSDGKPGPRYGVVNADDLSAVHMRTRTSAQVISYSIGGTADLRADDLRLDEAGASFELVTPVGSQRVRIHLPGRFNVSNTLAAAAVAAAEGVPLPEIARALDGVRGVPGRMERIDAGQPFTVVVDYAHTGPAFDKVLRTLRAVSRGDMIAVFGCAGGRSPERRPGMATVAAKLVNYSVLANEDPHEEDPDAILADIAAAMVAGNRQEGVDFVRIADRRAAIRHALARAKPGDTVLLAGKGHEGSIIIGREKTPWDERDVAREELAALGFGRADGGG